MLKYSESLQMYLQNRAQNYMQLNIFYKKMQQHSAKYIKLFNTKTCQV